MKIEFAHKPIGELNGPWAFLLKASLAILPIFMSTMIAWGVWVTKSINNLEVTSAVINKVSEQISANATMIATHEKALTILQTQQVQNFSTDNSAHEILHQKVMNEVGGIFGTRFDEIKAQIGVMQKDILKVQLLLEGRIAPIQSKRQQDNSQ